MPTYEYECQKCGHKFEQSQRITDEPLKRCPKCKGKVKRLLGTGVGVIFKGSGFYATDYRSPGYKAAAKRDSESGGDKPSEKKSSDGKDKKAASKD